MIIGEDALELGRNLIRAAREQDGTRMRFVVDPSKMTALQRPCVAARVPMLTGHGDVDALAEVIHSFHQWGKPISMGLILTDGFLQFWVEKDEPA